MKMSVAAIGAAVLVSILLVLPLPAAGGLSGENCARTCVEGETRFCEYHFTVEWFLILSKACYLCPFVLSDCYRPHCLTGDGTRRAVISINRQFPGPTIEVCEGDTVKVSVHNAMANGESITIHWHGQHQRGTPYMDGTDMVTQCPISERSQFTYEFTAGPFGTHIYHAHTGIQMADGMLGYFIVHPMEKPDPHYDLYDHDCDNGNNKHTHCEIALFVQDWMKEIYVSRWAKMEFNSHDGVPGTSALINGRMKRYPVQDDHDPEPGYTPYTEFSVEQGKRYRVRMAVEGALPGAFKVSIEGHLMTVIAADGHDVNPVEVSAIAASSGERYDFILEADAAIDSYWVKAHFTEAEHDYRPNAYAILRYNGADSGEPTSDPAADQNTGKFLQPIMGRVDDPDMAYSHGVADDINVDELTRDSSQDEDDENEVPDHVFYMTLDMIKNDNTRFQHKEHYPLSSLPEDKHTTSAVIDNITFLIPPVPIISQPEDIDFSLVCNRDTVDHAACAEDMCHCVHAVGWPENMVVEIVLVNVGPQPHPMHMHGTAFRMLGTERIGETISRQMIKTMNENGELKKNLKNSSYRDTVSVQPYSYVVIRFYTDNIGYWLFHCHLTDHIDSGQILLMIIGNHADLPPVPEGFPRCGSWEQKSPRRRRNKGGKVEEREDEKGE